MWQYARFSVMQPAKLSDVNRAMRKVYLSYRDGQEQYVEDLARVLGEAVVQGHIVSKVNTPTEQQRMERIRHEILKDSEVTIYLIGEGGCNFGKDAVRFQKRELQASLFDGEGINRNGLLGVVLPEMYDKIFKNDQPCDVCGENHVALHVFDDVVLHEFFYNYFLPLPTHHDHWADDDRFCELVAWDEFVKAPEQFVEMAYAKTQSPVSHKVKWDIDIR